ncbi:MAG TPA: hypothetical protein VEX86_02670 [Longimicrobium sp.]|nr:hypothetical protein [Longimicrobium sp.]
MKPKVPFGFFVAGCFSAWFTVMMVLGVLSLNPLSGGEWSFAWRGAAALLAALGAVVTEALWRARPWVWRASVVLAVAYAAVVLVGFGAPGDDSLEAGIGILVASAVVVGPILAYIRYRAQTLWPPLPAPYARVQVSPPRPRGPVRGAPGTGARP